MFDQVILFVFCCFLALILFCNLEDEKNQRYTMMISGQILPIFILLQSFRHGIERIFPVLLYLVAHISVFYLILIILLPYLRKIYSARVLAILWMVPNYMLLMIINRLDWVTGKYVIKLSSSMLSIAFWINFIGAICIIVYRIYEHLSFRKKLLKDSFLVEDEFIINIWERELEKTNQNHLKNALVISNATQTPLSIGLFKNSEKIIIPNRPYTEEELQLIFRHELIHICKYDIMTKLFFAFFTSICWYNPLMWIAMKKCYDDLELSCDESVLLDADTNKRELYANLILKTASSQKGFTTCLSTDAKGLKYRLENIVKTRKKRQGTFIIAILCFVMMITYGRVTIVYGMTTAKEEIFTEDLSEYSVAVAPNDFGNVMCLDGKALLEYVSNLSIYQVADITGAIDRGEYYYLVHSDLPNQNMYFRLCEHAISVYDGKKDETYYISSDVDEEYLNSLLLTYPSLIIQLNDHIDDPAFFMKMNHMENKTTSKSLVINEDTKTIDMRGLNPKEMKIDLDYGDEVSYKLIVSSWDHSESYTIDGNDIDNIVSIDNENKHYKLIVDFISNHNELIEATYLFDIIFE